MMYYVLFVTESKDQRATRRMTREQYVWNHMIINVIDQARHDASL